MSPVPGERVPPGRVTVIGVVGDSLDELGAEARTALRGAGLVVGDRRHLEHLSPWLSQSTGERQSIGPWPGADPGAAVPTGPRTAVIGADADDACRQAAAASADGTAVCVLAAGDPGFFGVVRALLRVLDRRHLRVLPAPSAVSLAFARLGLPWDDATVVSVHDRSLSDTTGALRRTHKAAVLTSPETPPEMVGRALLASRAAVDLVAVCSRLGYADESVTLVSLDDLAGGRWDPLSVVIVLGPAGRPIAGWGRAPATAKPLAWGLPDDVYLHREGMVTRSEVRAVALGKLALPPAGILWDLGAGSGSVAIEAAALCPGLTVFAVEDRPDDTARITENAARAGADLHVVRGRAPQVCDGLPDPDRVFVGSGGLDVLDVALARLRPNGRVVATFVDLDRAAGAADRLGHLAQVSVGRGKALPDGGWHLAAHDPVFVAWGPDDPADATAPGSTTWSGPGGTAQ